MPAKDPNAYMRDYRAARRQPIDPRPCEHCGVSFTPQRSDARYCGDACRAASRRVRVKVKWMRLAFLKNTLGCAEPGCDAEHARFTEHRYHVATRQTEKTYWCGEHGHDPHISAGE